MVRSHASADGAHGPRRAADGATGRCLGRSLGLSGLVRLVLWPASFLRQCWWPAVENAREPHEWECDLVRRLPCAYAGEAAPDVLEVYRACLEVADVLEAQCTAKAAELVSVWTAPPSSTLVVLPTRITRTRIRQAPAAGHGSRCFPRPLRRVLCVVVPEATRRPEPLQGTVEAGKGRHK